MTKSRFIQKEVCWTCSICETVHWNEFDALRCCRDKKRSKHETYYIQALEEYCKTYEEAYKMVLEWKLEPIGKTSIKEK